MPMKMETTEKPDQINGRGKTAPVQKQAQISSYEVNPPEHRTAPGLHWDIRTVLSKPPSSDAVYQAVQRKPLTEPSYSMADTRQSDAQWMRNQESLLPPVQRSAVVQTRQSSADVHHIAAQGVQGAGRQMPHFDRVQQAFPQYNINDLQAYTGPTAAKACHDIGAEAYTTGNKIAFADNNPSLHTTIHETVHAAVHQGNGHCPQLKGGVGEVGDQYERQADAIADKVVQGQNPASLLTQSTIDGSVPSSSSAMASNTPSEPTHANPIQASIAGHSLSAKPAVQLVANNNRFNPPIDDFKDSLENGRPAAGIGTQVPAMTGHHPYHRNSQPLTGACRGQARIITNGDQYDGTAAGGSVPANLGNMVYYRDETPFLSDPTRNGSAATRMHALNSHLDHGALNGNGNRNDDHLGQPGQDNMFLGTAASNDNHSALVEGPIKRFIETFGRDDIRFQVDYRVEPIYPPSGGGVGDLPGYIQNNVRDYIRDELGGEDEKFLENDLPWLLRACATEFRANVTYYVEDGAGGWYSYAEQPGEYDAGATNRVPGAGHYHSTQEDGNADGNPLLEQARRIQYQLNEGRSNLEKAFGDRYGNLCTIVQRIIDSQQGNYFAEEDYFDILGLFDMETVPSVGAGQWVGAYLHILGTIQDSIDSAKVQSLDAETLMSFEEPHPGHQTRKRHKVDYGFHELPPLEKALDACKSGADPRLQRLVRTRNIDEIYEHLASRYFMEDGDIKTFIEEAFS